MKRPPENNFRIEIVVAVPVLSLHNEINEIMQSIAANREKGKNLRGILWENRGKIRKINIRLKRKTLAGKPKNNARSK